MLRCFAGKQPEQLELRDVGILKFVHQDVAILFAHLIEQRRVVSQQLHRLQYLRAKRVEVALAKQPFAHAVDARKLFLPGHFLFRYLHGIRIESSLARLVLSAQSFDVSLIIIGRDQLVLAARKKRNEIAQEFSRLGQAPEMNQPQLGNVAAQQDPVVDVVERLDVGIRRTQDFFEAEFMERAQPHAFGALADRPSPRDISFRQRICR